ncbi:MAG: hypothetical protein JST00_22040 [Deltaproteobacteria bacterium]|nr:hypothetical protein [Deltaproteobacteria bacterium]
MKSPGASPLAVPTVSLTPDRRRIDSDVRCFLRQPSTPWITFDKAPGEEGPVFRSPASSIVTSPMFPSEPFGAPEPPKQEPSSLAVASDLGIPARAPFEAQLDPLAGSEELPFAPARRPTRAIVGAAVALAVAGLVATVGLGARSEIASRSHRAPHIAYASPNAAGADITPPSLDIPEPRPAEAAQAEGASASPSQDPRSRATRAPASTPEQYGRLSIAGKARASFVFLDGKRLLGKGARSFTVVCGAHQIAVGERSNVKDVDVPCNAELVVSD